MLRRVAPPLLLALACASAVSAGEPTERLRTLFADANRILLADDGGTTLEARMAAVRVLVAGAFDAREAAAIALGRGWDVRSAAERDELARLYADLVERAYIAWIGSRARVHGDGVRVSFESESIEGDRAVVHTTLVTRGAGEMAIEYRLRRRDARWAVHDVVVDGLSLAESYRAQFRRVMRDSSYAGLVARLRDGASPSTLTAVAAASGSRSPSTAVSLPGEAATVSTPATAPAPMRVASVALVSDAPPVERRVAAPVLTPGDAIGGAHPTPPIATGAPPRLAALEGASAPVAATRAPAMPRRFWIQVGAFRGTEAASRLVERLREHRVTVATGATGSGPLARVLIGPFASRAAAVSALRALAAGGDRPFIALE